MTVTTKETIAVAMAIGDHNHERNNSNNDGARWLDVEQISNQKEPLNN